MLSMDEIQQALPGTLDPEDFDPSVYEDSFLKARNINITDEDIRSDMKNGDLLLRYIIKNSFGAATSQGSLMTRLSEKSKTEFERVKTKLLDKLFSVFKCVNEVDFNKISFRKWHDDTCQKIIDICSDLENKTGNPAWTYGNSQKILNLIIKYLVVITKRASELGIRIDSSITAIIGQVFLDIYSKLDIPVDSLVIEASWNHNFAHKEKLILPTKNGITTPTDNIKPWNAFAFSLVKPWSKWSGEDYRNYAKSLHEVFAAPLDWEGYAWKEVGDARKAKRAAAKRRKAVKKNS